MSLIPNASLLMALPFVDILRCGRDALALILPDMRVPYVNLTEPV